MDVFDLRNRLVNDYADYPMVDWDKPFTEFDAARERSSTPKLQPAA